MKKTLVALATAGALSLTALAASANTNGMTYVNGGIYDFGDSSISIQGSKALTNRFAVHARYIDLGDYYLRLGGTYFVDFGIASNIDTFIVGGVSHIDVGPADDSGAYVGVGGKNNLSGQSTLFFDVRYDSLFDGYTSVGARFQYDFTDNLAADVKYRLNTSDIDNEIGIGLTYRF